MQPRPSLMTSPLAVAAGVSPSGNSRHRLPHWLCQEQLPSVEAASLAVIAARFTSSSPCRHHQQLHSPLMSKPSAQRSSLLAVAATRSSNRCHCQPFLWHLLWPVSMSSSAASHTAMILFFSYNNSTVLHIEEEGRVLCADLHMQKEGKEEDPFTQEEEEEKKGGRLCQHGWCRHRKKFWTFFSKNSRKF